jgi:hypothetical protein
MRRRSHRIAAAMILLVGAIALLWVPENAPAPQPANSRPFVWGQDDLWTRLEQRFDEARAAGCGVMGPEITSSLATLDQKLLEIDNDRGPDDPALEELERELFDLVPRFGACLRRTSELVPRIARLRRVIKDRSAHWDLNDRAARDRLYRLLYASRAALEELLLQLPPNTVPSLMAGDDEPSIAPSVEIHGVTLHSGDILLSRGGAATSALIARGNDYPGNFSHVALLHVADDGTPTAIEAHIESGLGLGTAQQYLADTKLRILVLRLRADHPALADDPLLAHHAAQDALARARREHVGYDFPMDWRDPSRQFCSEVAYAAYLPHGVHLWRGLSSMSGSGLTRWLAAFGVENFVTLAPSDLEYDPQLRVVAEWRDPGTLYADHLDNATTDALLEQAEAGANVEYSYPRLPLARLAKGYSAIRNFFGGTGPIPEGMSATVALKVQWLQARHRSVRSRLEHSARDYRHEHHRRPPYWTLVRMAREAAH